MWIYARSFADVRWQSLLFWTNILMKVCSLNNASTIMDLPAWIPPFIPSIWIHPIPFCSNTLKTRSACKINKLLCNKNFTALTHVRKLRPQHFPGYVLSLWDNAELLLHIVNILKILYNLVFESAASSFGKVCKYFFFISYGSKFTVFSIKMLLIMLF